jgi:hypothetical protein
MFYPPASFITSEAEPKVFKKKRHSFAHLVAVVISTSFIVWPFRSWSAMSAVCSWCISRITQCKYFVFFFFK